MSKRAGRARKNGERYLSGDLKPSANPAVEIAPALLGRIKNEIARVFADPTMGNQIGQLAYQGQLTNAQAAAAFRIAEIYARYHRAKQLRTSAKALNYEGGSGGSNIAEDYMGPEQLEAFEDSIRKAEAQWKTVDETLSGLARPLRAAVYDLCVLDRAISSMLLPDVRVVLDHFAQRFMKGTDVNKSAVSAMIRGLKRSATPITIAKATLPRREDPALRALRLIAKKLNPALNDDGLQQVESTFVALRDRERQRRDRRTS